MVLTSPDWATETLPEGFAVKLDPETRKIGTESLYGGSPLRALRLSVDGQKAFVEIENGYVHSIEARVLGRKLIEYGFLHPQQKQTNTTFDVTIVIPAYGRTTLLERTLAALVTQAPTIVVDDGSPEPHLVADVAERHGAQLIARPTNSGPGAARSSGYTNIETEFVAFLDSDCVPPPDWIESLAYHFTDPLVAAVAPRIIAAPSSKQTSRYSEACGPLDMGDKQAQVKPGGPVSYVPTAALVVRRAALDTMPEPCSPFDPSLRVGEDVDLIWQLHKQGWRVRFDPTVQVLHSEPNTWREFFQRGYRYGTSAASLSKRHPEAIAPLTLHPWPLTIVTMLLTRRPRLATASFLYYLRTLHKQLEGTELDRAETGKIAVIGISKTWRAIGKFCTQLASPLLLMGLSESGTGKEAFGRQAALVSLLLGPAAAAYLKKRPHLNPATFCAAYIADDIVYGAGLWAGCIDQGTLVPVTPRLYRQIPTLIETRDQPNV